MLENIYDNAFCLLYFTAKKYAIFQTNTKYFTGLIVWMAGMCYTVNEVYCCNAAGSENT